MINVTNNEMKEISAGVVFYTGKLHLHKNLTHQGESGPGLDQGLLMPFQLQQDFGPGHEICRMYRVSAPSPESAHWGDGVTRTHWFTWHYFKVQEGTTGSNGASDLSCRRTIVIIPFFQLPNLHVFGFVGLLVNSSPALLSSRGLLDIHIVAIDRGAAIEYRWLP